MDAAGFGRRSRGTSPRTQLRLLVVAPRAGLTEAIEDRVAGNVCLSRDCVVIAFLHLHYLRSQYRIFAG